MSANTRLKPGTLGSLKTSVVRQALKDAPDEGAERETTQEPKMVKVVVETAETETPLDKELRRRKRKNPTREGRFVYLDSKHVKALQRESFKRQSEDGKRSARADISAIVREAIEQKFGLA